jgi:hypothetical protein
VLEPVTIPEAARGPWRIERFTISAADAERDAVRGLFSGTRRHVRPGTYTALKHEHRGVVMSDTPDEMRDHYAAVRHARGHVLINGLGIGMVLANVLRQPGVERVTVVEIDPDVIALVGPHYVNERVQIVQHDAYSFTPSKGERFGAVWHDIWDSICTDNLDGMTRLKRKYGRRADWQGCWCEELLRYRRAQERRRGW